LQARERLLPYLPHSARQVRCARFYRHKTEAIDPSQPWVWFDDDPFAALAVRPETKSGPPTNPDQEFLDRHGQRDRLDAS
jgi:hypothetical protein